MAASRGAPYMLHTEGQQLRFCCADQAQGGNLTQFIGDLVAAQTVLTCSSDCGCFPAAAQVTVLDEATSKPVHRRMNQLQIGDKVNLSRECSIQGTEHTQSRVLQDDILHG